MDVPLEKFAIPGRRVALAEVGVGTRDPLALPGSEGGPGAILNDVPRRAGKDDGGTIEIFEPLDLAFLMGVIPLCIFGTSFSKPSGCRSGTLSREGRGGFILEIEEVTGIVVMAFAGVVSLVLLTLEVRPLVESTDGFLLCVPGICVTGAVLSFDGRRK